MLLLAFREVKRQELKSEFSQATVLKTDSVPHPAANNIITIDITKNKGTNNVRIVLKDGTVENYNLDDAVQKAALEKKYGKIMVTNPSTYNMGKIKLNWRR